MKKLSSFHSGRAIFSLMILICCILIGAVLKIASAVILPFTIAILLAFVMYPLVKFMDKLRFPRVLSIFLIIILIVILLSAFGMVLFTSGSSVLSLFPQYEQRMNTIYFSVAPTLGLSNDESLTLWENLWGQLGIRSWIFNSVITLSNSFFKFVSGAVLVTFFVVFILMEASFFKEKLETAFENRSNRITRMGHDLMTQVTRYLTAKFFISLATGASCAIAFRLIGIEFAIVWAVLQFILNFIPTLGSIAGGFTVSLFALIQFWPEPGPVVATIIVVLAINMILGNFLDPKIVGEHVGISPLMVLVSLAIWGYLWGFAGMILAVPMTVIIKIVCENIPMLEPVSVLISSRKSVRARKAELEKASQVNAAQDSGKV